MTTASKPRHGRKTENDAEIRVRLNAKTKSRKMSSHIPNAETARAIEEGLSEKAEPMTREDFRKFLEEA